MGDMKRANLELTIDRLLLPNLPPGQRALVVEAIEAELTRLWMEQGVPSGATEASVAISGAHVEAPAGAPAREIGVHVAQSIYRQLAGAHPTSAESAGRSV
jgi:hypothetical protein